MTTREKQKAKENRIHQNASNLKDASGKKLSKRKDRITERELRGAK